MADQDIDDMLDKIRGSFNDVDTQIINGAKKYITKETREAAIKKK